ncbi:tyrosine phosphatase-like protein [Aspergillus cavernicola]|uniref:Very-long-chain (3R)-3-hydroxyacyl-CoA dehydratase n=1 Tax=Aspergillus cavernicola TaxID=176166 RepID=A0ABR4J516_9EURO
MSAPTQLTPAKPKPALSGIARQYLLAYNGIAFFLWITCTIRSLRLIINQSITENLTFDLPALFAETYSPLLLTAQSLAILEILHSLFGLVRAPFLTTAMQVASRLFVVWGILYPFHEQGDGSGIVGGKGGPGVNQVGDYAYLGCLMAWGITECIRYGYFVMQINGGADNVPAWWNWLRYNTFYVLYPIGISSECTLAFKALPNAADLHPLYWWAIVAVLTIYVPGSYVLYTHMIKQRRRATNVKKDSKKDN